MKNLFRICFCGLIVACCVGKSNGILRADDLQPKVLCYNIHHAEGIDGVVSLDRIADVIRRSGADVVALQEVDRNVPRSGGVDQAQQLAQRLGMHYVFGGNLPLQGGEYGNAILSKYEILSSVNHPLPNLGGGEQRGILQARLAGPDKSFTLLATHWDHRANPEQRIASAEFVIELSKKIDANHPLLLAGDLNATSTTAEIRRLQSSWSRGDAASHPTIPVAVPERQIDYVMTSINHAPVIIESTVVMDEKVASDHRPIYVTLSFSDSSDRAKLVSRILFGSCIEQDQPAPILATMAREQADLLLFLGDNIYANTEDADEMHRKYQELAAMPEFQQLIKPIDVMAVWDDHDYGVNDGGADFKFKVGAQQQFVDFWSQAKQLRFKPGPGVYSSRVFGPVGRRVQVILLDTRYFRSPLKKGERRLGGPYLPDADATKTMLGEAQWNWFETQLQQPAEIRLIGSGIQCLPSAAGQETWANLPLERQRLLDLVQSARSGPSASLVALLSGDRHWSELSMVATDQMPPLYELTSSSLNQNHPRGTPTENTHRANPRTYHKPNYGLATIDWTGKKPSLTLEIRDQEGQTQLSQPVEFTTE
ncbi:alkaline phosphatase D family protein [Stieleria sp. TO1_6]|uniref:endonuclease/exonuclease/phosphatase family protein n=1 Tax=Stieleria tagensis TaxID=2956795 RepID=UPI00209B86BC|nr:endonuclease/exonuclease/phosphatase family protein [Stieleria tagensis]MCO8121796.1 alkaline phosphatase D family protein [Stieleria tagensis]